MSISLENRFKRFLEAVPSVELIDEIVPSGALPGKHRADYLLSGRRVVVELKTLTTDTSPKAQRELDRHRNRDDYPIIPGAVELYKILRHLPDGDQINRRIYGKVTRSVEDALRTAEAQIRDTENIFALTDNVGLVVLLNECVDILAPNVVVRKTSQLLCRKEPSTSVQMPIDFVWLLFESHITSGSDNVAALPSILLEAPSAGEFPWFDAIFEQLQDGWARLNNSPLVHSSVQRIRELLFRSTKTEQAADLRELTNQQYWERRYRANPYLRSLRDSDVLAYGAKAFGDLSPYFVKDGPRLPLPQLEPLFAAWSDFLDESRQRGLDLRDLPF